MIYNAVPGHVLRYIVKGSGEDVIDSGRVKPTGSVRMMKFIGYVKNCRDLGGWACDGGTVRYGRMYRCAAPGAAESADAIIAKNANIRYHFDLRDNASLESSQFGSEVYYKRYPLSAYYSDLVDLTKSHYAEMAALLRAVFNGVGYQHGYRLNSAGEPSPQASTYITGFIPVHSGDTVRFEGMNLREGSAPIKEQRIAFYDANKAVIAAPYWKDTGTNTMSGGYLVSMTVPDYSGKTVAFARFGCYWIDSHSIITVNEEIG